MALLPLVLLAAGLSWGSYHAERERAGNRTTDLARGMTLAIERELRAMTASMEALALSPSLAAGDLAAFRREADALLARHFPGAWILLLRPDGQQLLNTQLPAGVPLPVRLSLDTTHEVAATGRPAVSDVYWGAVRRMPVVAVDVPVRDAGGQVTHVLSLSPQLSAFAEIIRQARPEPGWTVSLLDRQGTIVAREPNPDGRFTGETVNPHLLPHFLARNEGNVESVTLQGIPVFTGFSRPGPTGWGVAVGVPRAEVYAPLWRNLSVAAGVSALALLSALLLARQAAAGIARPIRALMDVASEGSTTAPGSSLNLREADAVAVALAASRAARAGGEERLRRVVEAAHDHAIITLDAAGCVNGWSRGAENVFGWTEAAALGRRVSFIFTPENRAVGAPEAAMQDAHERGFARNERWYLREDGAQFWGSGTLVPLRDAAGGLEGYVKVCRDETARKEAEAVLARGRDELERLVAERTRDLEETQARLAVAQRMEALGQLAGGVAHDFNNVLQAVQGGARLIEGKPDDAGRVRRLAAMIAEAAARGAAVTRRLLAFSRRADLHAEPVDASDLLGGMREILAHTLGAGIDVRVQVSPRVPPLLADKGQLETVLVNLASNARDATGGNGTIILSAMTEVITEGRDGLRAGAYVRLSVADTGAGMDAATLARATEPFFTTKGTGKGTGLGLAMARGFAEQSGGALVIESVLEAGTTVRIWLPVADRAPPNPVSEGERHAIPDGKARVLLVDDEALVREITTEGLEAAGYVVLSVGSGLEALESLDASEVVDLLVSDLSMPGMDGLMTIREAQRRRPGLPAILLTGFATDAAELALGGVISGSFSLLRKPIEASALAERIAVMLKGVEAAGEKGQLRSS